MFPIRKRLSSESFPKFSFTKISQKYFTQVRSENSKARINILNFYRKPRVHKTTGSIHILVKFLRKSFENNSVLSFFLILKNNWCV